MNHKPKGFRVAVLLFMCLIMAGVYYGSTKSPPLGDKPVVPAPGTTGDIIPPPGERLLTNDKDAGPDPLSGQRQTGGENPKDYSNFVICLDPGHPSESADGRTKVNGTTEVEINWEIANKLKARLTGKYGIQVILTRSERDKLVTNRQRAETANAASADLFLRLHCDWDSAGQKSGFTFYYPDRQGKAQGHTGPASDVIVKSRNAAYALHTGTAEVLGGRLPDQGIKTDNTAYIGHKQGGALTGSVFSRVPVVLVEMVFLSNKQDAEFIKSLNGQEIMADALTLGIISYLNSVPDR